MKHLALLALILGLAACQTTVNPQGEASPELAARIDAAVVDWNDRAGEELTSDILVRGSSRMGNTHIIQLEARNNLAEATRRLPRNQLATLVEADLRRDFCRNPSQRTLIDIGGRLQMQFVDRIGRMLFKVDLDRC